MKGWYAGVVRIRVLSGQREAGDQRYLLCGGTVGLHGARLSDVIRNLGQQTSHGATVDHGRVLDDCV